MTVALKTVEAELVRSIEEWSEVIKADLRRSVEGTVAAGKHLTTAQAEVGRGAWQPLLKSIGIDRTMAFRLMKIGEKFGNVASHQQLPSAVFALYELSRLPSEEVEQGIAEGRITPNMTARGAKDFARPKPEQDAADPKPDRTQVQKDAGFVKAIHTGLSDDSIQTLGPKARQLLKEILTDALNRLEQL